VEKSVQSRAAMISALLGMCDGAVPLVAW